MKKLRGVTLAMGVAALIGLAAPNAHAGNLTITVSFGAQNVVIDFTSPFAQAGGDANNVVVNTTALNAFMLANGSGVVFGDLGGSSNNPGQVNPLGGTISETGTLLKSLLPIGGITTVTVNTSQTAFTIPLGPGTMTSASTAIYTNSNVGDSTTANSSFNTTSTTSPLTYTFNGLTNPQSFAGANSLGGLTASGSYSLDANAVISLTAGKDQFGVTTRFVAIPEPASIVMMLTGMPLPLVVMGLLRRRRAAA
jgi:hypothetical protein